jgi:hypothetical protein
MPPIHQLQRVPQLLLERLEHQGLFTTGLLLEVSETPTRRLYLADQIGATINDVDAWRDEALLLNLAGFGPTEQRIFTQAGIVGLLHARPGGSQRPRHRWMVRPGANARGRVAARCQPQGARRSATPVRSIGLARPMAGG